MFKPVHGESRIEWYGEKGEKLTNRISTTLSFLPRIDDTHLDASPCESFQITAQVDFEMVKLGIEIATQEKYVGKGSLRYRSFGGVFNPRRKF